jgi:hypothetical protein
MDRLQNVNFGHVTEGEVAPKTYRISVPDIEKMQETHDETKDLVIDESNFSEHFFDARKHRPKHGQVLAKFRANAEFIDGKGKQDIIYVLKIGKAQQAAEVMKKIHCAVEPDCYRVCREICEDLLCMSEKEVEMKSYSYLMELLYYTLPDNVPQNDPMWETIRMTRVDKNTDTGNYKSVIELSPTNETMQLVGCL